MNVLMASIRYAARQVWTSRVFTVAVVLTLALGIGGTTAIFTLIDAVMLRSLPVAEPERLYRIGDGDEGRAEGGPQGRWGMFSFPLYERLKAGAPEFADMTAFYAGVTQLSVRRQGTAEAAKPLRAEYVTGSYFSTFGVGAAAGRVFTSNDDQPSAPPAIVLSHHAWQGAYGADPAIVGSTFAIEGHPFTVVGVSAPGFFGDTLRGDPPDIWIPLQQEPMIAGSGSLLHQSASAWLRAIGRLRPGASIDGVAPRLTEILRQWLRNDSGYPANWMPDVIRGLPNQTIAIVPAGAGIGTMKEQYGASLRILLAICGLVLLMACANVANLLLARAVARRTQTAVRLAIGATRRQLVAEALTESVLFAFAGGLAGLLVATGAAELLIALAFRSARFVPISTTPSPIVLAIAAGLALTTGIVFGAAPAWFATRTDPIETLRGAGRSTSDRASRARTAMLVVQATLSVVLVAAATMLGRSLDHLQHQDVGYRVEGRVMISLNRLPSTYTPPQLSSLYRDVEDRLARLPGVQGTGLALYNPLTSIWAHTIVVDGHQPKASAESGASWNRVSAEYLQNLGVATVRGRAFSAADNETAAPVAIVNEAFAKRFFRPDEDPIDQHFGVELPENAGTFRIVGIVRDTKFTRSGLTRPARPMFYLPLTQRVEYKTAQLKLVEGLSHYIQGLMLVTDAPPGEIEPAVRRTLAEADPNLTVTSVRTMQQQIDLSFDRERAVASLAGLFGLVALVLAAVGIYGVTAYMVAQQANEIQIRMALGADRAKVIRMVLGQAFQRVAVGLVLGVPLAIGAARLMAAQLYGVSVWDPIALTVAAGSLIACALVAALIPAGRAASIAPMTALRTE